MERVLVKVDPDLKDLIPEFLRRKREDSTAISEALAAGDFAKIKRLAHNIKGEGGSFGFDPLSEIGAELERSASEANAEASRKLALRLADYLERVEVI